ncbi:DUF1963 domain-containing protein [Rhizobiales bacterium RZME27]|uniref:DUF1963 domain-containing protein n=1 Tax=Endobacterium cereale TaxID=2663029 RepID=A0A6A8AI62_9HYPH|nr:DUF1963 domain-containing protein [Endobacterium cereale]MEB2843897.1 DUF1963 domain-containing protein [Endobacterium cereale]MQY49507.1 DUF1963 domain-containing protein [Endobacterium cereale]
MTTTPFPETREALSLSLQDAGFDMPVVEHLTAQARPAILLVTSGFGETEPPLGTSRLGGRPDLPPDMAWPTRPPYPDAEARAGYHRREAERLLADSGKPRSWMTPEQGERFSKEHRDKADAIESEFPLAFFGQFDLADLSQQPGFDLAFPDEGRLLVFYDFWEQPEDFTPAASVGWKVVWDKTPASDLVRAPFPAALTAISDDDWSSIFKPAHITGKTVLTPIPPNDKGWNAFPLDDDEALEDYHEWLSQFGTPDMQGRANHQFGGFPQTLQNGLQARSQLAANGIDCGSGDAWRTPEAQALLASANDWRLVLQIGVDAHTGMKPPGAYYVLMRDQDIAARNFDRARVTYQCD